MQAKSAKPLKSLKQLVVVSSTEDRYPDDLDGYVESDHYKNYPAAFVPSKVPARRIPSYMNILIHEHHITPHIRKMNMMSKLNTLLGQELNEIEKCLDIDIWQWKWRKVKIDSRRNFDIKSEKVNFDFKCIFAGIVIFCKICDIFMLNYFSFKFQNFLKIVLYVMC